MQKCTKCGKTFEGDFCPRCGTPVHLKRIDRKYVWTEIAEVVNFDKGVFLTIKELFIRPGESVRGFLTKDRNRLVKPILFILITSLIYSLLNNLFKLEDQYVDFGGLEETTNRIFSWIQNNYGYANLLMSFFIAGWLKLLFRKREYNIYEISILLCFAMGMGMLILALFAFIQGIFHLKDINFSGYALFLYIAWAIGDFYGRKKIGNYLKGILAYVLGMVLFFVTALLIGYLTNVIFNLT